MISLARKYRPKRFADLVAQDHVAAGLSGAVARNRVAHAYLLTGPRGVGKTTAARILAMALNCEQRKDDSGEPCGECDSCARIWSGAANLDVVEIDAASNRGVEDARELRERAMYAASGPDRSKVYIVDEAHMLTREAWNALLKILEEPPARVVFVFATTEPQKIQNTAAPVLSRLQRFDFRRIGPQAILERLKDVVAQESVEADEDALALIARVANGGLRDGLSLLDQALAFEEGPVTAERVRQALGLIGDEMYAELLDMVAERRTQDVFPFVARLVESGADLVEFVSGAGDTLRALLLRILGGQPEGQTDALKEALERRAAAFTEGDVLRMLRLLAETENAVRRSPNARLHVEALLLHWTMLDRTVELSDVLAEVRGGAHGQNPSSASQAQARPRAPNPASAAPEADVRSATSAPVRPRPPSDPPSGPSALDALRDRWADVLEFVGGRRRMVREALTHATPAALEDDRVVLAVSESQVHLDGLERSRALVEEALGHVLGRTVRVAYRSDAGDAGGAAAPAPAAQRMDQARDRAERLQTYRQRDPALDEAVDALDLELLD